MAAKTAFVTGATGLLGGNLCRILTAEGWRVRGLVRSGNKARRLLGGLPVELVRGDMTDVPAFAGALDGVDEIHVNPATARARLVWQPALTPLSRLLDTIARIGYRPHPITPEAAVSVALKERRTAMRRLVVAGLGMMQVMTYAVSLYAGAWQGMSEEIREFLNSRGHSVMKDYFFFC